MLWMFGAAAVTLAVASAQDRPPEREMDRNTLIVFIAPDTPGLRDVIQSVRSAQVSTRFVLLASDFTRWPESFLEVANDFGTLAMVDKEGLALAKRYGVRRTPCFLYRHHIAYGSRTNVKEMLACSR